MNAKVPFYSFVIPVYNVAGYLRRCIDSISNQRFSDWEIILVDDGSKDDSAEICDELALADTRIKVFHQENLGVAVARNKGLDEASGVWIWFVDSDDYIVEDALMTIYNTIIEHSCDTVLFRMLDEWNGVMIESASIEKSSISNLHKEEFLDNIFCYANPSMLFKNSIIQSNRIRFTPGIRMGEDLELQYKYLFFSQHPILSNKALYVYSHRENSAMTNPDTHINNLHDCFTVANNLWTFLKEHERPYYHWLSIRIRQIIKSGLQSASRIPLLNHSDLKTDLKKLIDQYNEIGYDDIDDFTVKLARFNPALYFTALNIYLWMKKTLQLVLR